MMRNDSVLQDFHLAYVKQGMYMNPVRSILPLCTSPTISQAFFVQTPICYERGVMQGKRGSMCLSSPQSFLDGMFVFPSITLSSPYESMEEQGNVQ